MLEPIESTRLASPATSRGSMREVVTLAYPVVLSTLTASATHVIDSAFVGRLGATELAAVGYGGIWIWTALTLFMGTASGVQTFVSQCDGAGRREQCGGWAWQGFYALAPLTIAGTGLFVWALPSLLGALGPSPALQHHAYAYVSWRALGALGLVTLMVLSAFFRGLGDTRTPLVAAVISMLVNVTLDYGLIFGELGLPAWGVAGAGAATAVAEWTGAVVLLVAFRRPTLTPYRTATVPADATEIRRFLRTSLPIGGQWAVEMSSFALFSTLVARMGDAAMAASQVLIALLSLSFMQAIGISMASATLVGRYIGARDFASAEQSHRTSMVLGFALAAGIAGLLMGAPDWLLSVFTDDPEVVRLGRPLIVLGGIFQAFDAMQIIVGGSLRGAGDTRWPFLTQSALAWGFMLPLAYLISITLGHGLMGAWWACTAYVLVLALVLLQRFRSGSWRTIEI